MLAIVVAAIISGGTPAVLPPPNDGRLREGRSIADLIAGDPRLRLFSIALQRAGMDARLRQRPGDWVVFAPTDDALTDGGRSIEPLPRDPERLRTLVARHVTTSRSVRPLPIDAKVLQRNIRATNGVLCILEKPLPETP